MNPAAQTMPHATLALVSCADSGELHLLRLDPATGALDTLQVLTLGGQLMPMAFSPDKRRVYVARRSDPLAVITLALWPRTAEQPPRLQTLAEAPLPASMAHLAVDRSGRWLFSASYGSDMVAVSPIDTDGLAGEAAQTLATGRHAHAVLVGPDNRQVWVSALGDGQLHHFDFDAPGGLLRPATPATIAMPPGTGPRHLCTNARGDRLYVLGELDGALHVFEHAPSLGMLRHLQSLNTLPPGAQGAWAADLQLSPCGRWLYSSDRHTHTLCGFAVHPTDGLLHPLGHAATETQPRGFAWTPDGCHLLVAGQTSHGLRVHAVRPDGRLGASRSYPVGQGPNWVLTVEDLPGPPSPD